MNSERMHKKWKAIRKPIERPARSFKQRRVQIEDDYSKREMKEALMLATHVRIS